MLGEGLPVSDADITVPTIEQLTGNGGEYFVTPIAKAASFTNAIGFNLVEGGVFGDGQEIAPDLTSADAFPTAVNSVSVGTVGEDQQLNVFMTADTAGDPSAPVFNLFDEDGDLGNALNPDGETHALYNEIVAEDGELFQVVNFEDQVGLGDRDYGDGLVVISQRELTQAEADEIFAQVFGQIVA